MAASKKKLQRDRRVHTGAKRLIRATLTDETGPENLKRSLQFVLSNFEYHRYLDVNSHQIEQRLERVYEKLEVNSQGKKAERLKALVGLFLNSLAGTKTGLPKTDAHYAILSVLLNLSESPTVSSDQDIVGPNDQVEVDEFDWTSYLLEDLPPLKRFSDGSSSDEEWSEEGDTLVSEQEAMPPLEDSTPLGTSSDKLTELVVNQYWKRGASVTSKMAAARISHDWIASQGSLVPCQKLTAIAIREEQLIRETLWLLMTPENGYVYSIKDGAIVHNTSLCMSHLSEQSLCSTLSEFTHYGSMLLQIQSFVDSSHGLGDTFNAPMCATSRAFAGAIEDFLQKFRSYIVDQEKKCCRGGSIMTLSTLKESLSPWFHQLSIVHEVLKKCLDHPDVSCCSWVHNLILQLENAVSRETQLSNMEPASTIVNIWMKTMRPYILFIDHWLTTGSLNNCTDEFIFHRNLDIDVHYDDYWGRSIVLEELSEQMPLFLQPICNSILEAGKAMEMLQAMGFYVEEFVSRQPGSALYSNFEESTMRLLCGHAPVGTIPTAIRRVDVALNTDDTVNPLLSEAFRHLCVLADEEDGNKSASADMRSIVPLEILLDRGLHPLLLDHCSKVNGTLLDVLRERHHIYVHLSNLKKYFLLETLHDLSDFYTGLFDDLSNQEFGRDALFENILNWKLHVSLKASSQKDADRLLVMVESKDSLVQGGLFFNALKLNYKAPWPVNIVITPACQDKYNQIYQFLLSVKRVKYCLEQINCKGSSRQEEIGQALVHQLSLLRYKMLQFINAIHDYFMTRILHTTSHEFKDALSSVDSLDKLIAIHESYLATITERCLLHPKLSLIREAVVKVLNMAVRFHRKWQHGLHTFSMTHVTDMSKDFSNCSYFLSSTLHRVTKKANFPHLESLSLSIGASHPEMKHGR